MDIYLFAHPGDMPPPGAEYDRVLLREYSNWLRALESSTSALL